MKDNTKLTLCSKCGYNVKEQYLRTYGSCLRCGNIMDEKIHFKYEMSKKMKLWRGKFK